MKLRILKTKYYYLLFLYLFTFLSLNGQNQQQKTLLIDVLSDITKSDGIIFNYKSSLLQDVKVFPLPNNLDLSAKIKNLEAQTQLTFNRVSDAIITISKAVKICGYIKDSTSQLPLEGATVNGESGYAIADENGYFEIDLKSLYEVLFIRFIGFKTIERSAENFNLEQCKTIVLEEQEELMSAILLKTYLVKGINRTQDWATSIDYEQFSLLPGLIESDVLQTVQALPSVLSADETVSNLNIRGGSNDQNLILWDGIKMYQTGHFFGLISSFNPHMTQRASVINNGTDVTYTDGVSGTIHMQTEQQLNSEFKGVFGLNFLNAELFTDIPVGKKSSLQISSRKSLDDLVRTPTYDVYFDRITQETEAQDNTTEVENSNQEFDFNDVSLRWLYHPSEKDAFRLNFIHIDNTLSFNETADVEGEIRTRRSNVSQNSLAFGFNYQRQWNEKLSSTLNVFNTDYELQSINADVLNNQLFLQENIVSETNIKLDNLYQKNQWQFNLGYNFVETEIINLNDIDLPRFVRRDEEVLRTHAAFGQAWYTNADNNFSIRGGIRANYLAKFEKYIIEPRLSIRKTLNDYFEIEALGEFKHQATSQIVNFQNDFLGIEKRRWQLSDDNTIPILESKQVSIGATYSKNGWLIDTKAYYKNVDGITTQSQSFTTKYEFARETGSYDVFGVEFLCRKKFNDINSWLSYSYVNNTYTFEALQETEFPSNFDISHAITLGSTYSNDSWDISAGINYRIGKPTSIPIFGDEVEDNEVNFDSANQERLRDYLRIDASAIYKFRISKTFRSEIGASVWNISNRENTINNYFRINDSNSVDRFSRFSLGLTTNAVFRLYF